MLTTLAKRLPFRFITFATGVALLVFPGSSAAQSTFQALRFDPLGAIESYAQSDAGWSFVPTSDLLVTAIYASAPQVLFWRGTNQVIATYAYTGPHGSLYAGPATNFQAVPALLLSAGQSYSITIHDPDSPSTTIFWVFANGELYGLDPFTNSTYISQFASYYVSSSGEWTSPTTPPSENVNVLLLGANFQFQVVPASPPPLTHTRSGANIILTWPTNAVIFTLQSTTNLVSPAVWDAVSPPPVVINDQNTVTNTISGTRKFYRLSQ